MKIGFTVGVYDLLHEGHINSLKFCKQNCDYLNVGIMTDFWCHVQKGHDRPYQSLQMRMSNLRISAGNLIDNIVILDTLDMHQYLQMVDVWFKGEDQKNMRPFDYGNVIYVPRTPNISTSMIIENNRDGYELPKTIQED